MRDPYRLMGHVYDILSNLYSGNRIPACKEAMIDQIQPGTRVLFAGVGHGKEAIRAAEKGARVTVVDFSETMLGKFEKGMTGKKFKHPVQKVHSDILAFPAKAQYDYVFANFFLNVFPREKVGRVVDHLAAMAKPGGHVVVGDFCYPNGNFMLRIIQNLNWFIAVTPFFLGTNNAFHNIYNYPLYLKKSGLLVETVKYHSLFNMNLYWSILARKTSAQEQ